MKKVMRALRIAFVYIGTMVGAGFATGEEIQLYFGNSNIISLIVSSICTGLFCMLLLTAGRVGCFGQKSLKIFNTIFALSGIITAGIMLSGVRSIGNSSFFAVVSLIICLVVALYGNFGMKIFNFVAVPFIIIAVIVIAVFNTQSFGGGFHFLSAVGYSAMNIFFESILMYKEGEKADKKEILLTSIFVTILIFALIFSMRKACLGISGTMPFLHASKKYNLGWLAFGVIILAIYSTVVNCLSISVEFFSTHLTKSLSVSLVFFMTIFISVFPFDLMIAKIYPVFSYTGIALNIYILIMLIFKICKEKNLYKGKFTKLRRIKE